MAILLGQSGSSEKKMPRENEMCKDFIRGYERGREGAGQGWES